MEIKHFKTAEETLAFISSRPVSHTTKITCASCGETFSINNRHKTPWEVHPLGNGLCQIMMPCARCEATYDITTCIINENSSPITHHQKPSAKICDICG